MDITFVLKITLEIILCQEILTSPREQMYVWIKYDKILAFWAWMIKCNLIMLIFVSVDYIERCQI